MFYGVLADLLVVFHLCFVGFVIFGGFLVVRRPMAAFAHIPAAMWGVIVEWSGWICPLTPLENHLREAGGGAGYQGSFVDHYVMPVLYPNGLTRTMQYELGALILLINLSLYTIVVVRWRKRREDAANSAAAGRLAVAAADGPGTDGGSIDATTMR